MENLFLNYNFLHNKLGIYRNYNHKMKFNIKKFNS